jgi:hypothetical protein
VPIFELARCDLGETWSEEDGTISVAVYNVVFNLDRQEFEKLALMIRQTHDAEGSEPEEERAGDNPRPLASCEFGQAFYEGGGEVSISVYNFSFFLSAEEFTMFSDMMTRTERRLTGEFPVRKSR